MAIRNILKIGDDALNKKCRNVAKIDGRILTLLDDMAETMRQASGLGLAAPQVGVLRRVVVIDTGDGLIELINPKLTETSDETIDDIEGCLSVPGKWGYVVRPKTATVRALDRHGKEFEMTGEGLLARAFCHELEHLEGNLFTEKVSRYCDPDEIEPKEGSEE
ncbi:MAG: peptide deformylase [Firmicutes bacterium]|nr:peptide deformylase [Bacillota bacterium]